MYRIQDEEFEPAESAVSGYLDGDGWLYWAIDACARRKQTETFGWVEPELSFTQLPHPERADRRLDRLHFANATAYDESTGMWIGDFYIFDAHFFRSDVVMTRVSPSSFLISWKGEVNLHPETCPGEQFVPFEIAIDAAFSGIRCALSEERKSRVLLERFCDASRFDWIEAECEQYGNTFRSVFVPCV